jgi:hypothetical protein
MLNIQLHDALDLRKKILFVHISNALCSDDNHASIILVEKGEPLVQMGENLAERDQWVSNQATALTQSRICIGNAKAKA